MSNKEQVELNYKAFHEQLPSIPAEFHGKFALMKDAKIIEYFDTARDAYAAGQKLFKEEPFSAQEVTKTPVDLGFFSRACLSGKFNHKGLLMNVGVMRPGDLAPSKTNRPIQFPALIDTGASRTCVSEEVIRTVGLQPIGKRPVISATHSVAANVYLANLVITFASAVFLVERGIQVFEFVSPPPLTDSDTPVYQLLLGRDIICRGGSGVKSLDLKLGILSAA